MLPVNFFIDPLLLELVFWQVIVSPHMAGLASALAEIGANVTYVAVQEISSHRALQGWRAPKMHGVSLALVNGAEDACSLAKAFPRDAIHLTGGIRGVSYIEAVIELLSLGNARWGALMETIDERTILYPLKRFFYGQKLRSVSDRPDLVLGIGASTPAWIAARGYPAEMIYPFAYFLPHQSNAINARYVAGKRFRIGFVGQLIPRKRLDLLIDALSGLPSYSYELVVIGSGELEVQLTEHARRYLGPDRFSFFGTLPMGDSIDAMATFDLLVLPSDHDGWGAVVSEALMAGTPAICSDACGVSCVVRASGVGGVFPKSDISILRSLLSVAMSEGKVSAGARAEIAEWSTCLGAKAGARYLHGILAHRYNGGSRPMPPWFLPNGSKV